MVAPKITFDREVLRDFCARNHIRKLAFFGSVLRDDFRPDSDVDLLVEFEPGHTPGYYFITLQEQLSRIFGGRTVDLVTEGFLHPRIRDRVLSSARVEYVQG